MFSMQLNPPLWLYVPELDMAGLAHVATWPTVEDSIYWTLFMDNGEVRTLPNERVRAHKNWTLGRPTKA